MLRNKKTVTLTLFLSTLLLTSMLLFGVLQCSASNTDDAWSANTVGDESDAFFDDSYVHEIHLYFEDENWYDTLYNGHANDPNDPYFPAKFVYDDIVLDPVGVRFKGLSSFMSGGGGDVDFGEIGLDSFGGSGTKKSFRIDFNEYQENEENATEFTFFGLKKLNLNNGYSDDSLLREKLFYDFASNYVTTVRTVFTRVYVNGEYYGLYLAVEHIDQTFVESRFGNNEAGNIYKIESATLGYLGSDVADYAGSYELKTNLEENDWSDLIELTNILSNTPVSDLAEQLEAVLDVDSTLYSLALLNLFSSLDSYISSGRNYYLYDRDDTGQFTFLLWDANMAFGGFGMGMQQNVSDTTLDPFSNSTSLLGRAGDFQQNLTDGNPQNQTGFLPDRFNVPQNMTGGELPGGFNFPQDPTGGMVPDGFGAFPQNMTGLPTDGFDNFPMNQTNNDFADGFRQGGIGGGAFATGEKVLLTNVMSVESYNRTYLRAIAQMLREGFDASSISVRIQELADLIRDDVYADPNLLSTTEEFEAGLTELVSFVEERVAHLNMRLQDFAEQTDIQLNELMTINVDTIADAEGDYDSWVELCNLGPGTVNTDNMLITDDQTVPNKWQLPAQNLDDGQCLLLWLDRETSEGADHVSFNLNLDGGELYLYMYDSEGYTVVSSVSYPALDSDVSYACSSDGNNLWCEMSADLVSPGVSNPETKISVGSNAVGSYMSNGSSVLFINEFMADNGITVAGPEGNSPDWIELYNAGTETIDLTGMYLTDNLNDPTRWQFPEGTTIGPKEFLIVWAARDGGELYATFGLDANGEEIGLFDSDGVTLIDSVTYVKQIQDVSYGRSPDGGSSWNYLLSATPGYSNHEPQVESESSVWSFVLLFAVLIVSGAVVFIGGRKR